MQQEVDYRHRHRIEAMEASRKLLIFLATMHPELAPPSLRRRVERPRAPPTPMAPPPPPPPPVVPHGVFKASPSITVGRAAAQYFGISYVDVVSARRDKETYTARHIAMYLARKFTTASLPTIGRHFGNRDHTTIMSAVARVKLLLERDQKMRDDVEAVRALAALSEPVFGVL